MKYYVTKQNGNKAYLRVDEVAVPEKYTIIPIVLGLGLGILFGVVGSLIGGVIGFTLGKYQNNKEVDKVEYLNTIPCLFKFE